MAFVVTAKWTAKEGQEEVVAGSLAKLAGPSRAEEGVLFYQLHRDPDGLLPIQSGNAERSRLVASTCVYPGVRRADRRRHFRVPINRGVRLLVRGNPRPARSGGEDFAGFVQ